MTTVYVRSLGKADLNAKLSGGVKICGAIDGATGKPVYLDASLPDQTPIALFDVGEGGRIVVRVWGSWNAKLRRVK